MGVTSRATNSGKEAHTSASRRKKRDLAGVGGLDSGLFSVVRAAAEGPVAQDRLRAAKSSREQPKPAKKPGSGVTAVASAIITLDLAGPAVRWITNQILKACRTNR